VAVHTGGPGSNDHTFDAGFDATVARVTIVKSVNGQDANTAPGPVLELPGTANFTYLVTNTGQVALTKVAVTDNKLGAITCPKAALAAGESMTCTASAAATQGQYTNVGTVTGTAPDSSVVTSSDVANYFGQPTGVLDTTTIAGSGTTGATLTGLNDDSANSGGSSATATNSGLSPSDSSSPSNPLAHTGNDDRGITLIGIGLLMAGIGVLLTTRRRPLRPIPATVKTS
jgi:LPXTG-motif cell wall-anchored protein